jgi:hypothetical protein
MLECDQDQFPEGIRLVGAKLGSIFERPSAEQTPPRLKAQPLAVDRFERTNPALVGLPAQPAAPGNPSPAPANLSRDRLLMIGMGAALIVLIVIVVILLLL